MKLWKTGNRWVHVKGSGRKKGEDGCGFKGPHEEPYDETVLCDWGWSHNSPCVIKLHRTSSTAPCPPSPHPHTHMHPGETWNLSKTTDCINVHFLVVILFCSFAWCYEGYMDLSVWFLTIISKFLRNGFHEHLVYVCLTQRPNSPQWDPRVIGGNMFSGHRTHSSPTFPGPSLKCQNSSVFTSTMDMKNFPIDVIFNSLITCG